MAHSANITKEESGNPIPIFTEENGKFRLQKTNLQKLLLRSDVKDNPVMILSIAGPTREGKSFILNFMIRFLQASTKENWLSDQTSSLNGFSWKGGSERQTLGILMWSEPFQVETENGKISVLLMDTQGLFDDYTEMDDVKTIFCMSCLLSSLQVYNVMKMIKDDMMQCLTKFLEYAKMAETTSEHKRLLQRLMFLIRDWPDETKYKYGRKGGQDYLNNYLEFSPNASRNNLKDAAESLICFLLPRPGQRVCETRKGQKPFEGALNDIGEEFIDNIPELMHTLFSPENVAPKSVNGQVITGKILLDYAEKLDEVFSGDELPKAEDVLTTIKAAFYGALKEEFIVKFRKIMQELVDVRGLTEEEFSAKSKKILEQQLEQFDARPKYADDDDDNDCKQEEIKESLRRECEIFIQKHRNERVKLWRECCLLADEKCSFHESQLQEQFKEICCTSETLKEASKSATWKALDDLPDLVRNSGFDRLFRSRIQKGMEKITKELQEKNEGMLRKMEGKCKEIKMKCESYVNDKMNKMINRRVWRWYEIERCKRTLERATSAHWDELSRRIKGPKEVLNAHKALSMRSAKAAIACFEKKNSENKDQLDKDATHEAGAMTEEYTSLMTETMGRKARTREELETLHETSRTKVIKSERLHKLNAYLKDETIRCLDQKIQEAFEKLLEQNAFKEVAERKFCYVLKCTCIEEAKRLVDEVCGRRYLDDMDLKDCVAKIERRVLQKFDSECQMKIPHVILDPRSELEKYLENELLKIAQERNRLNEIAMEEEIKAITNLMQTEARLQFEKMFERQQGNPWQLQMSECVIRNKLDEIIIHRCSNESSKESCRKKLDEILSDGRKRWKQRQAELEENRKRQIETLETESIRMYGWQMEEMMENRRNETFSDWHEAAWQNVSCMLRQHDDIVSDDIREEIAMKIEDCKMNLSTTLRLKEEKIERNKVQLRKKFNIFIKSKLGTVCCNDSDLREYELEAINFVNGNRRRMDVEFEMPTIELLATEIRRAREWNDSENGKFERRCKQLAEETIKEYSKLPAGLREQHSMDSFTRNNDTENRLKSFRSALKGNRDTVEEQCEYIRKEIDKISIRMRQVKREREIAMTSKRLAEAKKYYEQVMDSYIRINCCHNLRPKHNRVLAELQGQDSSFSGIDKNGETYREFKRNRDRSLATLFKQFERENCDIQAEREKKYRRVFDDVYASYKTAALEQLQKFSLPICLFNPRLVEEHYTVIKNEYISKLQSELPPSHSPYCATCKGEYIINLKLRMDVLRIGMPSFKSYYTVFAKFR